MHTRWKPHVTLAAVIEKDGKFLLVEEQTADGLRLNNPAGHFDPGESPEEGCAREVLEETAFQFTPAALVGIYISRQFRLETPTTYVRLAYCGDLGPFDPDRQLDHGIVRTLWMGAAEIRACPERHRSPMLMQCIDDYLAGKRFPLGLVTTDPSVYD
jgi:8-oxo-dGTP pyrophosphatase MutT (NUDIX family)